MPTQPLEACPVCGHLQPPAGGSVATVEYGFDVQRAMQGVWERTIVTIAALLADRRKERRWIPKSSRKLTRGLVARAFAEALFFTDLGFFPG